MRHKPCWSDSLGLEILYGWALALIVAVWIFMLSECAVTPAHAELYLDLTGGYTNFLLTAPDGDYIQKDLPHTLDLSSAAYRVGLGWRFNERWSVQGGYVNLGTITQSARFVADADYDAKAGKCLNNCANAAPYRMTDAYHGGELTLTRTFHPAKDWGLDLKAGGALMLHRFTINKNAGTNDETHRNYGRIPMTVAGVGLSYKWAYVEMDYYHGIGGSNCTTPCDWPLSNEMLVTWAGIKVPLTF